MIISQAKYLNRLLLILFAFLVLAVINSNAKIIEDSLVNIFLNFLEFLIILIGLLKIQKNRLLSISPIIFFGILFLVLVMLKINSLNDMIIARWYIIPIILLIVVNYFTNLNVTLFLIQNKKNILFIASLMVLLFFFQSHDLNTRILAYTLFEGYSQFASSIYGLFFIFLHFMFHFYNRSMILFIYSTLLMLLSVIITFQSGVKTYLFIMIITLLFFLLKNIKLKNIFKIILFILIASFIFINIISIELMNSLIAIYELITDPKVLTASGRLPDLFNSIENESTTHIGAKSVSEFWINKIISNPLGYGWVNPKNSNLPAFDGAIWEVTYSTGIFSGIILNLLIFNIIYKSYKIYLMNKSLSTLNNLVFLFWFNILYIISAPFNSILLPLVFVGVTTYILKYKRELNEN